jgi:hypothetical protein
LHRFGESLIAPAAGLADAVTLGNHARWHPAKLATTAATLCQSRILCTAQISVALRDDLDYMYRQMADRSAP